MSEASHTPEPWSWGGEARSAFAFDREGHVYPPDHTLTGGYQHAGPIATVSTAESGEANGRRIVACVNACRGQPTEELERCVFLPVPWTVEMLARVLAERIGLLAECEKFLAALDGGPAYCHDDMRDAVAKARREFP